MTSAFASKVWFNGAIIDADLAHIATTDRGFTLGDGLFETMLWTGDRIRFVGDHLARLFASAQAVGIPMPESKAQVEIGLEQLTRPALGQRGALRLTLTRGSGPRGLALPLDQRPQMLATLAAYTPPTAPVSLASVSIRRNPTAPTARHKTLSYIDNILALKQGHALGADDVVMLGTGGNIACSSAANIVIHYRGQALTPGIDDGALPGIVRARLISAGLIEEANITPTMLEACTYGVLTNALLGVRGIAAIDSRRLEFAPAWIGRLRDAL